MSLPLEGIRILDLSRIFAGPFCTQLLADFGAEIIKIEPVSGDQGRWAQPLIGDQCANFFAVNRNKKSITLDLKKEDGKAIFKKLASNSDVVVDVSRPGTMDKLGLSYDELKKVNPRIIYCAISGFGLNTPLSNAPAHEINITGMSGITDQTRNKDGSPTLSPVPIAAAVGGSLYGVIAILMALIHRQKTGQGQLCDIAMMDGAISLLNYALGELSGCGNKPEPGTSLLDGGFAYYNIYETSDNKYMSLGAHESKYWRIFCEGIGRPEYIAGHLQAEVQEEIKSGIRAVIKERSQAEWMEIFKDNNSCFTPVLDLEEMCEHPQAAARDMVIKVEQFRDSDKDMMLTGIPFKLSESPGEVKLTFAQAGEHTEKILSEAGYTAEEIQSFKIRGVI